MLGLVLVLAVVGSGCDSAGPPPGPEARWLIPLERATLAVNDFQPTLHRNGWISGTSVFPMEATALWYPKGAASDTAFGVISQAGLWLAGRQQGDVRANVSWVSGPDLINYRVQQPDSLPRGVFYVTPDSLAGEVTNWPAGAPTDAQGQPTLYGDAMAWVALTSDTTATDPPLARPIMGLEVRQAVYGYAQENLRGVVFIRYAITNRGADLTDAYLGFHSDTDFNKTLADPTRGFDGCPCVDLWANSTGYDRARELTYTYFREDRTCGVESPASCKNIGAVTGFTLLETPGAVGVTSHRMFFKNNYVSSEFGEWGIEGPGQVLWALQGLSSEGEPMVNPETGEATKFAFTGDPVTGGGWLGPSQDVRSLLGSGPFTLASGETVTLTVVWAVTRGSTLAEGLEQLAAQVEQVRSEPRLWRYE